MPSLKADIMARLELMGGRHDEVAIYGGLSGDPGLAGGPAAACRGKSMAV